MKKFIAMLMAAVMVAGFACGCSKKDDKDKADDITVRIGALKGPTTIGVLGMTNDGVTDGIEGKYDLTMATDPSEIAASLNAGNVDIALIPANLAAKLYKNTDGAISVIDINTLGVLYCVTGDASIASPSDLEGKTIVTTGQGNTPEYAIRYIMEANGIKDYELDFRSEATEIAALLAEDPDIIAVLPQPFVTVACSQNEAVSPVFSLSDEWDKTSDGSRMVTGVTVVRNEFLEEHEGNVAQFLEDHARSVEATSADLEAVADLTVEAGIVGAAPVAVAAIPNCNIVCITGEEMKSSLSGYLSVLFDQDPTSVGGSLPGDDFYFVG